MAQLQKQKEFVAYFHRTCVVLTLPSSAIDATGPRIGVVGGEILFFGGIYSKWQDGAVNKGKDTIRARMSPH
jgi:hypothetical protein